MSLMLWVARWKRGVLSFDGVEDMAASEWFRQLPLFAIVSILSGLLGALFNALHKALLPVRIEYPQWRQFYLQQFPQQTHLIFNPWKSPGTLTGVCSPLHALVGVASYMCMCMHV